MRRLILAWILAAVSIAGCVSYHENTKWEPEPTVFELVCEALIVECEELGIAPPLVIYSQVVDPYGVHGLYVQGEPYIFINPNTSMEYRVVEVHETIHYVIYEAMLPYTRCGSERAARIITELLTGQAGGDWEPQYECVNVELR